MAGQIDVTVLRRLGGRDFHGYLVRRLPHDLDGVVDGVVLGYRGAPVASRQALLSQMTPRVASVLSVFGQRKAVLAVRRGSREDLRMGVIAMGMAEEALEDYRDNLIVLAAVNHSAAVVGTSLDAVLDDVRDVVSVSALARFRAFARRDPRDRSLQAMGLAARGSDDAFIYVSGPTS